MMIDISVQGIEAFSTVVENLPVCTLYIICIAHLCAPVLVSVHFPDAFIHETSLLPVISTIHLRVLLVLSYTTGWWKLPMSSMKRA
jgi:hypothetical protein